MHQRRIPEWLRHPPSPSVRGFAVLAGNPKYLNNIVELDHRLIKRITKSMLGFKNFYGAQRTLAGIELLRMLRKGQMTHPVRMSKTPAEIFYALAGLIDIDLRTYVTWSWACDRTSPRHVRDSIASLHWQISQAIAISITRCPCCAGYNTR
jgi:hypothetical protein